jgi:beta-galactosidase/beta-glucuronidase
MLSISLLTVTTVILTTCLAIASTVITNNNASDDVQLPQGVKAVWDMTKAYKESTSTRERICLNGLWRWQPSKEPKDDIPMGTWGYFKVPGPWIGINSYIQKDCQTVYAHPSWEKEKLGSISAAWYQREITIPDTWAGRRIFLCAEYLNSYAEVYLDDIRVGEMRFPSGEVEVTSNCHPGSKHVLTLYTVAMPLKGVMLSYGDTNSAKQVEGSVLRRGLCGDVYLASAPIGSHIEDVRVDTSVRRWEIAFDVALEGLEAEKEYGLYAQVMESGRNIEDFKSDAITSSDLKNGRFTFTCQWKPDKLWDTNTPQNKYDLKVSLNNGEDAVLDVFTPVRFGFREFWIDGRDFYLNGTRIFCFAVPFDNALLGAAWASYEGTMESLKRLKTFGVNLVYTHNYGCEPGSHLSFEEALRAADDTGMLVSFSQPHFGHYEWTAPDADETNGYASHAEFYVRVAQNHPSVVMYSMSHNSLGYGEDQNPDLIDGIHGPTEPWTAKNRELAGRAEAIVKRFDSTRIVYHHSSGNFGSMHTINCYLNFVPIQERSDWFEHWATEGIKPLFLCEYGDPWGINWTTYRGWYKDERAFGSAKVPWEFCMAEWNSQFLGDKCYQLSEKEKENLRFESKQWNEGKIWYRWDYPSDPVSFRSEDRETVWAMHISDNWRAFRTWGLSAFNSWSYANFWDLRDSVDKSRKNLEVDWDNLQKPGFSPDYIEGRYERFDLSFERSDWTPNDAGKALIRNNQPLLAYIGGKSAKFTSKNHNFFAGETVEKQIVIINNLRQSTICNCSWKLSIPQALEGNEKVIIQTGEQVRIPLKIDLPNTLEPGEYKLNMTVKFSSGEVQEDSFVIRVIGQPKTPKTSMKIALFDPKGETGGFLRDMGILYELVDAKSDLTKFNVLIVGKEALTVDEPAPDINSVSDGLNVIMFEQKPEVLEKRLGFRIQEYGLRQVFERVPVHPILAGLGNENLKDWRGEATIVPPRLTYELKPRYGPTIKWCDIEVTRPWRCGNYGNVATVLIEKPTCGDFLPIVDGGFNLQYSPLLEYHEGKGMVLICQMDVIGRTESEPSAIRLVSNMLNYVSNWSPSPQRRILYVGDPSGRDYLEKTGISVEKFKGDQLSKQHILVVGPGAGQEMSQYSDAIRSWISKGGHLLTIGLDESDDRSFLPLDITMKKAEYICALFEPAGINSLLAGIGPADVTIREPRELPLISGGAKPVGDGILAIAKDSNLVFCQLVPWQFNYMKYYNLKKSFLRTSFLVTRVLSNMGAYSATPFISRFSTPLGSSIKDETGRWLNGFYLDIPEEMDDPYRYFRW